MKRKPAERKWKTEEFCTSCHQRIGLEELADKDLLDARKVRIEGLRGQAILHAEEISSMSAGLAQKTQALRGALGLIDSLLNEKKIYPGLTPAERMELEEIRAVARTI